MFSISGNNPEYLVLSGLDRDEYTAESNDATGAVSGDGNVATFTNIGGDADSFGIVFTYDAATGQYLNSTYGDLANLVLTTSTDADDNEAISLFASNSSALLTQYADNPYALSQYAASAYVGTVSVVTQPAFDGPAPAQATPDSICSVANTFVGQAWNDSGCWVLACNISAEAGASLPLSSTSLGVPGQASGEWIVAFNGPAGQKGDWQSMVKAGEMVVFETSFTSGHITTVVSGSGSTAELIDNIAYENADGSIINAANDGSPNDVVIAAPHLASQEFAQAVQGSVVIYELDTPTITVNASTSTVSAGSALSLAGLFSASDPANKAVTEYQLYDTGTLGAAQDELVVNGATVAAQSIADAVTVAASALSSLALQAGNSAGTDVLDARAFNGNYWGDWQSLTVNVVGSAAPSSPPTVSDQTANQTWQQGQTVAFTLAGDTFTDPQGQALTYSASLADGSALPSWLTFNAATETFSGTVAMGAAGFAVVVTATDASGLTASETFAVTTPALVLADTASNIQNSLASLEANASNIVSITPTVGAVTVDTLEFSAYEAALDKIVGGFSISDTAANIETSLQNIVADTNQITTIFAGNGGVGALEAPVTISAETFEADESTLDKIVGGFAISDTAANIESVAALTSLTADAAHIATITATDAPVSVGMAGLTSYEAALDKIAGGFVVSDTAAAIGANFDALEADVSNIQSISFTDAGAPVLTLTQAQVINDAGALAKIVGSYNLDVISDVPAATTADMILRDSNSGNYEIYDIGVNAVLAADPLGAVGANWQVAGIGGFNGSDVSDMILRDSNTGVFEVYDISQNKITSAASMGGVGLNWAVVGFGDFSGNAAESDMLMRDSNTGAFEVYDITQNKITSAASMGGVGLNWTVAGFGDFSGNAGETDMLMRDSNTGAFEVYDITQNRITSAASMGGVGLNWTVAGFGDFSGNAGETDMLMRDSNTGNFEVYDISQNKITSAASIGAVGLNWMVAGFGDFSGNAGETDMLMRDSNSGAFQIYDINQNKVASAASVGTVGLNWTVGGLANDPQTNASNAQLVQAMASFSPQSSSGLSGNVSGAQLTQSEQLIATPHSS